MTDPVSPVAWDLVVAVAGAATALIAAAFSGITLYMTGRRETRRWLREAVLDALTQFLDSSFARPSRSVYDVLRVPGPDGDIGEFRARSQAAHRDQNEALTRLRLLASDAVVRAAEQLHHADDALAEAVLGTDPVPDPQEWAALRLRQKRAREELIIQARRLLGLSGGMPVSSLSSS